MTTTLPVTATLSQVDNPHASVECNDDPWCNSCDLPYHKHKQVLSRVQDKHWNKLSSDAQRNITSKELTAYALEVHGTAECLMTLCYNLRRLFLRLF
jgi:hypothetical protein